MKFVGELDPSQLKRVEKCNQRLRDPERLLALWNTGLMDTPREEAFDRLCRLAARLLDVPLTIVSLVNDQKQFFKADYGLPHPFSESRELSIDFSLCRYTMTGDSIISADASQDPFLKCHPSTIPWGIGSLIVLPLITPDGHVLGTFCCIQPTPRDWTESDFEIMRELTASIMTEINLRNQVTKLKVEQNLRDTFIAAVSHDLRTPLTVIHMTAQLLSRKYKDNEDIQSSVAKICQSTQRSENMIQNLLDVNHIKSGTKLSLKREDCALCETVENIVQELTLIYGDRFEISYTEKIKLSADINAIRRIIENLVTNAAKYSYPGSKVEISLISKAKEMEIAVRNWGNPISEKDQITIFEPFHRTVDAMSGGHKGWGLGLPLVRGLVEAHNGQVSVTSSLEEGTSFQVILPLK